MTELGPNYIGGNELVFNNDKELGIHSGGFSVKSIMMKAGMSPIMTLNNNIHHKGGTGELEKVSDLFKDLVVPNWALSYNNRIIGGKYNEDDHNKRYRRDDDSEESDEDDDIVSDDLHEKLLDLVKEHNAKVKNESLEKTTREKEENGKKKRVTRKNFSSKGKRSTRKYRNK
jgi:hypothetical protein